MWARAGARIMSNGRRGGRATNVCTCSFTLAGSLQLPCSMLAGVSTMLCPHVQLNYTLLLDKLGPKHCCQATLLPQAAAWFAGCCACQPCSCHTSPCSRSHCSAHQRTLSAAASAVSLLLLLSAPGPQPCQADAPCHTPGRVSTVEGCRSTCRAGCSAQKPGHKPRA